VEMLRYDVSDREQQAKDPMGMGSELGSPGRRHQRALTEYFEYSSKGVDVLEDGLKEMSFGEYLVERGAIDRFQLLRALQLQDRHPGVLLGECVAALGYVPYSEVEQHLSRFNSVAVIDLD
jgi:hypothetical protein